jgi:hypothetical protein
MFCDTNDLSVRVQGNIWVYLAAVSRWGSVHTTCCQNKAKLLAFLFSIISSRLIGQLGYGTPLDLSSAGGGVSCCTNWLDLESDLVWYDGYGWRIVTYRLSF